MIRTKFLLAMLICVGLSITNVQAQNVLTIEQALETALQNSPQVRSVQLSLERQENLLIAQQAGLKTKFSLGVTPLSYSNKREFNQLFSTWVNSENFMSFGGLNISQPILWTDGVLTLSNQYRWLKSTSDLQNPVENGNPNATKANDPNISYDNSLKLSLQQPLFTYNRRKIQLRQLEYDYENAMINFALRKLEVERQVTNQFFELHRLQMSVQISEEELKNQQDSYDIIEGKVNAGLTAKEEFYQAKVNLAQSKSTLFQNKVSLENALDQFKQLIGMSLYEEILVFADVYNNPIDVDTQEAIEKALASRLELRQREIEMETSRFEILRAKETNEFRGDLSASYEFLGNNDQFNNVYANPAQNQEYSLSLSIPIWDWGERKARKRAAEATVKSAELTFSDERNTIILSVRSTVRNLQNLLNQIDIAQQNVENAQLTYDINLERYKNGDYTSIDLNRQQKQLSDAKLQLTTSQINYKNEVLNLKIQTLWDFENDKSYFPLQVFEEGIQFKNLRSNSYYFNR